MAHEQLHRQKVPSPLSFHLLHSLIFLRLYLYEQEGVAVEISGEGPEVLWQSCDSFPQASGFYFHRPTNCLLCRSAG